MLEKFQLLVLLYTQYEMELGVENVNEMASFFFPIRGGEKEMKGGFLREEMKILKYFQNLISLNIASPYLQLPPFSKDPSQPFGSSGGALTKRSLFPFS